MGGSETLRVTCDGGWEYQSKGDWTKSTADTFAESYCEGRGWNAHSWATSQTGTKLVYK